MSARAHVRLAPRAIPLPRRGGTTRSVVTGWFPPSIVRLAPRAMRINPHMCPAYRRFSFLLLKRNETKKAIRGSAPNTPWNDTFVAGFAALLVASRSPTARVLTPSAHKLHTVGAGGRPQVRNRCNGRPHRVAPTGTRENGKRPPRRLAVGEALHPLQRRGIDGGAAQRMQCAIEIAGQARNDSISLCKERRKELRKKHARQTYRSRCSRKQLEKYRH